MEISKAEIASAAQAAKSASSQELRGAEILVKSLQAENVQFIWGYPGGAVLHIYDAFYKQETIQHVLVRHEQAAVHAADGYARATGEVGVALVTSGPGLTIAVILGLIFTVFQAYEYSHAAFGFSGNIYGATFFMATGFHGAHVIIGTIFLFVCLLRARREKPELTVPQVR